MAGQERDIDSMLGMVIAIVAIVYTIAVNFLELFRKKKVPPSPPRPGGPMEDFFESLKKGERLERRQKEGEQGQEAEEDDEEDEDEEERTAMMQRPSPVSPPMPAPVMNKETGAGGWRPPEEKFVLHSVIEDLKQRTKIEDRKLEIGLHAPEELVSGAIVRPATSAPKTQSTKTQSPIREFLQRVPRKKALIIAHEIIEPPIGFRRSQRH